MMSARPGRLSIALLAAGALLAGCGISGESQPRALDPSPTPTPTPSPTLDSNTVGTVAATVFLIRTEDQVLSTQTRSISEAPSLQILLDELLRDPDKLERDRGFTTQVVDTTLIGLSANGIVTIKAGSELLQKPPNTLRRALGQIVLTVTRLDDVNGVVFVNDSDTQITVQGPDGTPSVGALTASTFIDIVDQGGSTPEPSES